MFQGIRIGSPLYILYKNEMRLQIGEVINTTTQQPTYNSPMFGSYQTINIRVKADNDTIEFKELPSNLSLADYGNDMIVSDDKLAILNEVSNLQNQSKSILESIDMHKIRVQRSDEIIRLLDPSKEKEYRQQEDISHLQNEMKTLRADIGDIKGLLFKALNNKKNEKQNVDNL